MYDVVSGHEDLATFEDLREAEAMLRELEKDNDSKKAWFRIIKQTKA